MIAQIIYAGIMAKILSFAIQKGFKFQNEDHFAYWANEFVVIEEDDKILKFTCKENGQRQVLGELEITKMLNEYRVIANQQELIERWTFMFGEQKAFEMIEGLNKHLNESSN